MGIVKRQLEMTEREWPANNGVLECEVCFLPIEECTCPEWEELVDSINKEK